MDEVTTHETQPDVVDVATSDGVGTDSAGAISLDELNAVLGKNYKSLDAALAGVKETINYAGKLSNVKSVLNKAQEKLGTDESGVLEAITKVMQDQPNQGYMTREQFQEEVFFQKNESLSELRKVLTPLKNSSDETKSMSWDEFVKTEAAKVVVEPYTGYKEEQAKKSVLETNPRLGAVTDKLSQARDLTEKALQAELSGQVTASRQAMNQARQSAIASVLEAYEM